jgi:hypothetical protein
MQAGEEHAADERTGIDPGILEGVTDGEAPPVEPSHGDGGSEHPPGHHEPPASRSASEGAARRDRSSGGGS